MNTQDLTAQQQASLLLLQRGVAYPIPNLPFFRWFKKNMRLSIQRSYCGTLIRLSEMALKFPQITEPISDEKRPSMLAEYLPQLCDYIAIACINKRKPSYLKRKFISRTVMNGLTGDQIYTLVQTIQQFNQTELFINSIILASTTRLLQKMSPTEKRSQED